MDRRGKWGCSYRKTTLVVCSFNIVVAIIVLRSIYGSLSAYSGNVIPHEYKPDQIRKMEESIRIRRDHRPHRLIQLVKEMKEENDRERVAVDIQPKLKQRLTAEILDKLKSLSPESNITQQREALEVWRADKLRQAKQMVSYFSTSNTAETEAGMILRVLQSNWDVFCEDIGLWIPHEVVNHEHDDKPENAEEEEYILPGRPLPPECHAELHTDYDGAAVRWGLTHPKESAADCCQACLDQAKTAKPGQKKCNIWVYCPVEGGCYSPDIYEHKNQECWLKYSETPRLNFKDRYSDEYRSSHPKAPLMVPWVSGVISS